MLQCEVGSWPPTMRTVPMEAGLAGVSKVPFLDCRLDMQVQAYSSHDRRCFAFLATPLRGFETPNREKPDLIRLLYFPYRTSE